MTIAEQIGARIRKLRKAAGLSQLNVAQTAGLAVSYVSALERGEKNATILTLSQVADALGVSFEHLVAGELVEVNQLLADLPSHLRPDALRIFGDSLRVIHRAAGTRGRSGRR